MIFCKHDWDIILKTETKPIPIQDINCSMSEVMAEKLILGVTTVMLKCCKCKSYKVEEVFGKEGKL